MNFETLAHQEAQDALASVRGISAMGRLAELKQQARTRRRASAILTAAAVAVVMVAGTWLVTTQTGASTTPPPAAPPSVETEQGLCGSGVTCLGNDRYNVALAVPVTLTLTPDFVDELRFDPGDMTLDTQRSAGDAGVAVLEPRSPSSTTDPGPATPRRGGPPSPWPGGSRAAPSSRTPHAPRPRSAVSRPGT